MLPHKNSVYNFNRNIRLKPGLDGAILNRMKTKIKWLRTKQNKLVMICLDGMSVKSELTYCAKSDTFYEFSDYGVVKKVERNDPTKLATEAVVIMVSGIYSRFKQPVGYFLAHNTLGSEIQMKLTRKSIIAIRDTGLIPIALVMDQSTTNQKMIREAGGTAEHPIIQVDNENIAVMFDPPHLLKNARNALYKYNAVFEDQIASFNHIKLLFETDVASTLRLAPKLLYKAIQLPPFSKMNVSIATRTLSESCAIAIRHYVEIGSLPTAALQSASFIALHDKLFDTFNSKERYVNSIGKVNGNIVILKPTYLDQIYAS
ncbi:uncharacterized protein LOC131436120 isoform X2 [Malaya genurostris]|uniref:uncharacterized protein LOC131436120 isoform X2 n=1 Tax=Malaya genurostris TaxID=325434 RepID=UPI0026F3CCEA|nr:uncharacterized protein LOC131436120 isoform X2 [Malaya genurostris]